MKSLIKSYTFSTSAKTITLTNVATVRLDRLMLITDVTTNKILYNFADPTVTTATVATNIITLGALQGGEANGDSLEIVYDLLPADAAFGDTTEITALTDGTNTANILKSDGTSAGTNAQIVAPQQVASVTATFTTSSTTSSVTPTLSAIGQGTAVATIVETGTTTTAGALIFEVYDGTNWWAVGAYQINTLNPPSSTYTLVNGTNVAFAFACNGWQQVRVRVQTVITGTGSPQAVVILQTQASPFVAPPSMPQQLDATNDKVTNYPAGNTVAYITATGGTSVKSGAGTLRGFTINNPATLISAVTVSTIEFDNNTSHATPFRIISLPISTALANLGPIIVTGLNESFSTGCYVYITLGTSGSWTPDITVDYS